MKLRLFALALALGLALVFPGMVSALVVQATDTPEPTQTPWIVTATPSDTPFPSDTPTPTDTPTPEPTQTAVIVTATDLPVTETPTPTATYVRGTSGEDVNGFLLSVAPLGRLVVFGLALVVFSLVVGAFIRAA